MKTVLLRSILLFLGTESIGSLSIGGTRKRTTAIKRVALVGAGIAGLSLAHALKNSPSLSRGTEKDLEVTIFDSRKALDYQTGSGVQLNGGLAVLGKINPYVRDAVIDGSVPIKCLRGRNKSWQDGNSESKLWDYDVEAIFKDAGGRAKEELIVDNRMMWHGIMRGALQEILVETLPKNDDTIKILFGKSLVGIHGSEGEAFCEFSDGTKSGPFDLIVGCDGIKSAVKEYIDTGKVSKDASKREGTAAALYSGIRVGYAVTDADKGESNRDPRSIKQVFADGAYILTGSYGNGKSRPPCKCVFITSLDDRFNGPFKRKEFQTSSAISENADWSQDQEKLKQESRQQMIKRLSANNIPGDDVRTAIENSDRFFELGVYFHNPFSLSGWRKSIPSTEGCYAVLCGDSAHAMPPFLGQGANQAIQDAFSLAEKIHRFNFALEREEADDLNSLFGEYERARWLPTTSITAKAVILGYLETGGRDGFYSKFRDVFFKILDARGVPKRVLIDAATPKL